MHSNVFQRKYCYQAASFKILLSGTHNNNFYHSFVALKSASKSMPSITLSSKMSNNTIHPPLSSAELMTFNVLLPITSIVGFITNFIVILSVFYYRSLRRVPANVFVTSLAVADIIVCVVGVPLWLVTLILANGGMMHCQITFGLTVFSSVLSVYTLGVISYDRYAAVTNPFRHHIVMSQSTTYTILAGIWLIVLIFSLPSFIGWKSPNLETSNAANLAAYCIYTKVFRLEYLIIVFTGISLTIFMNIILYAKLLSVAKRHASQIESVKHEVENSVGDQPGPDQPKRPAVRRERNLKAAKTLGIVLGALVLCWVPFLVVAYVDTISEKSNVSVFTVKMLGTVTYVNSIINPIIYTYMSRDFRKAIKRILLRKRGIPNFLGSSST